jgi:hypothetical protein
MMKGSSPQAVNVSGDELIDARQHGPGGLVGKGRQQDPVGPHAGFDQSGHTEGQRPGLAAAGAGNDQQRPPLLHDHLALLIVEFPVVINHELKSLKNGFAAAQNPFRLKSTNQSDFRKCEKSLIRRLRTTFDELVKSSKSFKFGTAS